MKISGSATLHAPRERVWAALHDPAVLVATIPGCRRLEQTGTDSYQVTADVGVGALTGTYLGRIALDQARPPESFVLRGQGLGGPGTVAAAVTVSLDPGADGTTRLDYVADAEIGGAIAGVGQRLLAGVARKTAQEFFSAVDAALAGTLPVGAPAGPPARGPEPVEAAGQERAGEPEVAPAAAPAPAAPVAPTPAWVAPGAQAPGVQVRQGGAVWAVVTATWSGGAIALAGVTLGWLIGRRR